MYARTCCWHALADADCLEGSRTAIRKWVSAVDDVRTNKSTREQTGRSELVQTRKTATFHSNTETQVAIFLKNHEFDCNVIAAESLYQLIQSRYNQLGACAPIAGHKRAISVQNFKTTRF